MSEQPTPDRRRFLKTVGIAGLSSALVPSALSLAQTSPSTPGATPKPAAAPAAAPADTSAAMKKEPPSEDAKAMAAIIRRRYGKVLTDEHIATITDDFDGDLKAFPRLHAVKLANGDEPDFTFRP